MRLHLMQVLQNRVNILKRVFPILIVSLTTQYYAKTQPDLHGFDEQFLFIEAALDLQNIALRS